jgi:hypothetical protein
VTVIVIGWLNVPLATQVAYAPAALHEPIVAALADTATAATPPRASKPAPAAIAASRRNLCMVGCPLR